MTSPRSFLIGLSIMLAVLPMQVQADAETARKNLKRMKASDFFPAGPDLQLVEAAARGDAKKIDESLAKGAKVNVPGRDGMTPLFWTIGKQNKKGFRLLLERGADPNARSGKGAEGIDLSIMGAVAIMEDSEYLKLALSRGGNPNTASSRNRETVIYDAIMNSRVENVKLLIAAGANLNHTNNIGQTPVFLAANTNQYDIAWVLLQAGANPKIKNRWGSDVEGIMKRYGPAGIPPGSKQYEWYSRVAEKLKQR